MGGGKPQDGANDRESMVLGNMFQLSDVAI